MSEEWNWLWWAQWKIVLNTELRTTFLLSHYFLVYKLIPHDDFDRESMMRCRTKRGQECDYLHLGAQFYCIWEVSWCLLKCLSCPCWNYGLSWWAEVQVQSARSDLFHRCFLQVWPTVLVKNLIFDFWYHRERGFCEIVYFELYVWFGWFCRGTVMVFLVWFWFCFFLQRSWMTEDYVVWMDLQWSIIYLFDTTEAP